MTAIDQWILLLATIVLGPPLLIGMIRKIKATLQNRVGAPIHQPLLDLCKLFSKGELISDSATWILRGSTVVNAATAVLIAITCPWVPGLPAVFDLDVFLFIYLFVLIRFFTVLSSLDTGSPFGGFAASREVTLAVLVEPALMLCLIALAVVARTTNMAEIFSFSSNAPSHAGLWLLAACGLYLASLVELSRMPADDPTTHLELTMVHEAMILENSGPNLALAEYTSALKLLILMGISGQCLLHALNQIWPIDSSQQTMYGFAALGASGFTIALIEATAVKLRWTKLPEFIAYAVTFGLLCSVSAMGTLK